MQIDKKEGRATLNDTPWVKTGIPHNHSLRLVMGDAYDNLGIN